MNILILLGCPEPPLLIPSFMFLLNLLKSKGHQVYVAGNPSALKLIESADPEHYYLKNVGFQPIDNGLKDKFDVDYIFGLTHNDAGVNYIVTYKMVYNKETSALIFGTGDLGGLTQILDENGIENKSIRAYHNPTPINVILKRIFKEF
ncbi:DUF1890 domain-containing protein [Methanococcus voltae]|uniref:DUF1890 domain-containing protein n=2 Tax=Methanococcus voltae TaxID=2188 RepID=A0A8J7RFW4_METVO|nr:DUF1890 domain-containing protein [Methanococcus voltae]MBP2171948.1 hypothetical protein [Methanococcus voltae]MBP2201097.1 hypothetical protein [Methanococcus voltae]MCS3921820.1 hypothetical protein [Methanococcus voltae PS]